MGDDDYDSVCELPGEDVDEALPHLGMSTRIDLAALVLHIKHDAKLRAYLRGTVARYDREVRAEGT